MENEFLDKDTLEAVHGSSFAQLCRKFNCKKEDFPYSEQNMELLKNILIVDTYKKHLDEAMTGVDASMVLAMVKVDDEKGQELKESCAGMTKDMLLLARNAAEKLLNSIDELMSAYSVTW